MFSSEKHELNEKVCDFFKLNIEKIHKSIDILSQLVKIGDSDFDAKRDAANLLKNLNSATVLNCLGDNVEYFKLIACDFNMFERKDWCLKAAMVGAINVCEYLFSKDINPKNDTWLISYSICSGNNEWVKLLVKTWQVNIKLSKYCFLVYASRMENQDLLQFWETC
jgi:hypothetical protein